jgi:hypothetical protein
MEKLAPCGAQLAMGLKAQKRDVGMGISGAPLSEIQIAWRAIPLIDRLTGPGSAAAQK